MIFRYLRDLRIVELCDDIEFGCVIVIYFTCVIAVLLSKAGIIT